MCCAYVHQGNRNIHEPISFENDGIENAFEKIIEKDILERRYLAERILKRLQESDCPSVLGVYGGWGTGKTSLINLLVRYNDTLGERGLHMVNIDAWKYESTEGLLVPVMVQFKKILGLTDMALHWRTLTRRVAVTAAFSTVDALLGKLSNSSFTRKQLVENYEEVVKKENQEAYSTVLDNWVEQAKEVEETERAFNEIVASVADKKKKKKIVICIDNLDRCSPENVVRFLESVKVFFNESPHCTWMFAMDSDVVASYINRKYEGTHIDGYSYLDKIIPEQYHLSMSPTADEHTILALLRNSCNEEVENPIFISRIPQIPKVLVPRRLIKSAKKYADFYKSQKASSGVPPEIVMALSMLYHTWPDFYQRLSSSSQGHIKGILDNFFQKELLKTESQKPVRLNIPLDERFLHDKELVYFIQTAFAGYNTASSEKFVIDIVNGLQGLREGGLP